MVKESKASQVKFLGPKEEPKSLIGGIKSLRRMYFQADFSGRLGFKPATAQCFGSVSSL